MGCLVPDETGPRISDREPLSEDSGSARRTNSRTGHLVQIPRSPPPSTHNLGDSVPYVFDPDFLKPQSGTNVFPLLLRYMYDPLSRITPSGLSLVVRLPPAVVEREGG